MKKLLAVMFALGLSRATAAPPDLAGIPIATRSKVHYTCDGASKITATYLNARNGQSFALLRVKGRAMLFVNALSASGVRYVAGRYVWWTKGPGAALYDETAGENAPPMLSNCRSR